MARNPNRRNVNLTVPLSETEVADLETVAAAWHRPKTTLARELIMAGLRGLKDPEPTQPLPVTP
jgi:hypothetical protein